MNQLKERRKRQTMHPNSREEYTRKSTAKSNWEDIFIWIVADCLFIVDIVLYVDLLWMNEWMNRSLIIEMIFHLMSNGIYPINKLKELIK